MMVRRVKWGVLGTASIAKRRFAPAVSKSRNATLLAIASRELSKAQEFATEFNIERPYGSYDDLLQDPDIEAVYIPLPNYLHAEWTVKAARAGKHVLCEKPMACDAAEARAMAKVCRDAGVLLMEGFMYRLNPRTLAVRQSVENGLIGELRHVVVQFSFLLGHRDTYRDDSRLIPGKGAGSIMDLGCYCVNFCRYVFSDEPRAAFAVQKIDPISGGDLSTSAVLDFGSSRTALINCSFETAYRNTITLAGDRAILSADRFFTPLTEGKTNFTVKESYGEPQVFEFDAVDQFLLEIEHFSDCVLRRSELLLNPEKDAIPNALVIDAIRESARTGRVVELC